MQPLVAFGLWRWIEEHRAAFEPPVGNKVIWEDSQFTAMVIRGPNARRDFHVDPSDEIFYMLEGDMDLEYLIPGDNNYTTASSVLDTEWKDVTAVRINLNLQAAAGALTANEIRGTNADGTNAAVISRQLSHVVTLRNRVP